MTDTTDTTDTIQTYRVRAEVIFGTRALYSDEARSNIDLGDFYIVEVDILEVYRAED